MRLKIRATDLGPDVIYGTAVTPTVRLLVLNTRRLTALNIAAAVAARRVGGR